MDFTPKDIAAFTAYTVDRGEWRLGLGSFQYGLLESLDVSTHPLLWLLVAPNFAVKVEPLRTEHLSLALSGDFILTNTQRLTNDVLPSNVWVIPLEAAASVAITPKINVSLSFVATLVRVLGEDRFGEATSGSASILNPLEEIGTGEAQQVALASNAQLVSTLHWQLSRDTIAFLRVRGLLLEDVAAGLQVQVRPDEDTVIDIEGATTVDLEREGATLSVTGGYIVSWGRTHLLLGVGYGNWSLPFVNMVTPEKTAFLELDLYFRF